MGTGGLEDDGSDVVVGFQGALEGTQIASGQDNHGVPRTLGNSGSAPVRAGHGIVVPAVEVVLELDDLILPGEGTGEAEGHQGGLGAGAVEAHFFDVGHEGLDGVGPADFLLGVSTKMGALGHLFGDGLYDVGVGVTQKQCAVSHDVVDVFVAVDVPLEGSLAMGDVKGEGGSVAVVVGDSRWELTEGFLILLGGTLMLVHIVLQDSHGLFLSR